MLWRLSSNSKQKWKWQERHCAMIRKDGMVDVPWDIPFRVIYNGGYGGRCRCRHAVSSSSSASCHLPFFSSIPFLSSVVSLAPPCREPPSRLLSWTSALCLSTRGRGWGGVIHPCRAIQCLRVFQMAWLQACVCCVPLPSVLVVGFQIGAHPSSWCGGGRMRENEAISTRDCGWCWFQIPLLSTIIALDINI